MDYPHSELTFRIIGAAIEVHRHLGPGLLEGTYRTCLVQQLADQGLEAQAEVEIPVTYKGRDTGTYYRADLIVAKSVVVELKAVEMLLPVHSAQMLSYLKLTSLPVGLLINFNVRSLKAGVRRFVNSTITDSSPANPAAALPRTA